MTNIADKTTIEETFIPDDSEVKTPVSRRPTYRFSKGTICTGRDEDGSLEVIPKIVGRLRRIGVHSGKNKDTQIPYSQLEADIETSKGLVRLKCGITDKAGKLQPSTSALSFLEGLLELAKDELSVYTANSSTKKNAYGTFSTYANVWHYDGKTNPRQTRRRPIDKSKTMDQQWASLVAEAEKHGAWADRPASDKDDEDTVTHLSELTKEMAAKGWPTPEEQPAAWCQLYAAAFECDLPSSLAAWDDDNVGTMRLHLKDKAEMPTILADAVAKKPKKDPFA